jgi:hypothetical protein
VNLLSLPRDSAGFVRRQCPHCGRQFKTRPFPADGLAVQRYLSQTLPHENLHEVDGAAGIHSCLYCGKAAAPEEWLTDEHRGFLDRIAGTFAQEVRYEQLSYPVRTLRENPRPTFVLVPPESRRTALPPEIDDLELVPLVCCAEEAKVEPGRVATYCPRCGARQEIASSQVDR